MMDTAKIDRRTIPNAHRATLGMPLMGRPKAGAVRVKAVIREPKILIREPPEDRLRDQLHAMFSRSSATLERWKLGDR